MVKKKLLSKIVIMLVVMTMLVSYISPMQTAYAEERINAIKEDAIEVIVNVKDEDGNPVEGAEVKVGIRRLLHHSDYFTTTTDANGHASIIVNSDYDLVMRYSISKDGYQTISSGEIKDVVGIIIYPSLRTYNEVLKANSFKVKFHDAQDNVISEQDVKYNKSALEPTDKPSKEGYEFKGWSTDEWKQVQKNIDVKPEFEQIKHKVTFDLDGGKINDSTVSIEKKVNHNETVEQPLDPTKEGKKFEGWINVETTSAFDFSTKIVSNTQLKATYSDITPSEPTTPTTPTEPSVTEVNANLYLLRPGKVKPYEVTGKIKSVPENNGINYIYVGKAKYSRDFTEAQYAETTDSSYIENKMSQITEDNFAKDGVVKIEQDGYIYTAAFDSIDWYVAKCSYNPTHIDGIVTWDEPTIINYKIAYNLGNKKAENDKDNPVNYNVESDDLILKDAKLDGYEFLGWYTNKSFAENKKVTKIAKGSTGNKTLYAKFTPIEYTITYNNIENATNLNTKNKYTVEESYTFQNASKDNYRFDGWFDKDNNKVTEISKNQTGNIDLYAKWTLVNSIVIINFKYADTVSGDNLPQLPKAIEEKYAVEATYSYTIPKLYGFVSTHTSITGTANSEKIEYTVTYSHESTKDVTVNYYYTDKGTEPVKTEIVKLFESEIDENSVADLILERIGGVNSQKTDKYLDGKSNFNFETLTMNIVYKPLIIISGVEEDEDDTIIDDEETPGGDVKEDSPNPEDNNGDNKEDINIDDEETPGGDIKVNQNQESVSDVSQDDEKLNEEIEDEQILSGNIPKGTAKLPDTAGMLPQVLCGLGALAVIFGIVLKKKDK